MFGYLEFGNNLISYQCGAIAWNSKMWVAVGGNGINNYYDSKNIAYSYDGINWTSLNYILTNGQDV